MKASKTSLEKFRGFDILTFDVRDEKTLKVFFKYNTGRLFVISNVTQVCLLLKRTNSNKGGPVDYLLLIKSSVPFTSSIRINSEEKMHNLVNYNLAIFNYKLLNMA